MEIFAYKDYAAYNSGTTCLTFSRNKLEPGITTTLDGKRYKVYFPADGKAYIILAEPLA